MKAVGGLVSFGWSPSQLGVTQMNTHHDLLHLLQLSRRSICPKPFLVPQSNTLHLYGEAGMDWGFVGVTPGSTQLVSQPSPSWANIQIEKNIWTLTRWGPAIPSHPYPAISQLCQNLQGLILMKSWTFKMMVLIWHGLGNNSGYCDFQILNIYFLEGLIEW